MNTISSCVNLLIQAFVLTSFLLLILRFLFKQHRDSIDKFVLISNSFLILLSLTFLSLFIITVLSYPALNKSEQSAMTNRMLGPFWFAFFGPVIFKGLIPQILWIKKCRKSIWCSLVLIPFLLIDIYLPTLISINR